MERHLRSLDDEMSKVRELAERDTGFGVPLVTQLFIPVSLVITDRLPDTLIVMFMCNNHSGPCPELL